ncbi:MAG: hypothetical protein C1943_18960 [Halochromatium sp.]|nr:hypothetical protein [Halochromatium sp.]
MLDPAQRSSSAAPGKLTPEPEIGHRACRAERDPRRRLQLLVGRWLPAPPLDLAPTSEPGPGGRARAKLASASAAQLAPRSIKPARRWADAGDGYGDGCANPARRCDLAPNLP